MPRFAWLAALLIALSAATAAHARTHVLILSIDGLRPDALAKTATPNLQGLIQRGSTTLAARTIMPSVTLPSHTSMLTGVGPDKHHITWDDYEPARGVVQVPTIFELAHAQGLHTALLAGKDKFKHLDKPDTLDVFDIPGYLATKVAHAAVALVQTSAPDLLFAHLSDPDGAGHSLGWMSGPYLAAVTAADTAVGSILAGYQRAGLLDDTVVIVSADHGGHGHTHGTADPVDMTIPWIVAGPGIATGRTIQGAVVTMDTAATALQLLGVTVPSGFDGHPVMEAFTIAPHAALPEDASLISLR